MVFRDATGQYMIPELVLTGVFIADRPLDANEGAKGSEMLEILLPDDVDLADFELVEEDKPTGSGASRPRCSTPTGTSDGRETESPQATDVWWLTPRGCTASRRPRLRLQAARSLQLR